MMTADDFVEQGFQATRRADCAGAVTAFKQALSIDPKRPAIWKQLGDRLADQGQSRACLTAFLKCLSLEIDRVAAEHGLKVIVPSFLGGGSGYVGDIDPLTMTARSRGIFVASMPKAGTVYVANSLCNGLGKVNLAMNTGGIFPNIQIPQGAIERLLETGAVYVPHCDANRYNLIELSAKLDRMVVHVRDPRQGLVAWANFIPELVAHQDRILLQHYDIPDDLFAKPFSEQLDWHIDNYMPVQVNWIQGWMDADADPAFKTRLLFLTNEQLGRDPEGYFRELLAFHDIPESLFAFPERPKSGEFNFREGRSDEWLEVMTPSQRDRINAMVPEAMRQKFGWL